MTYVSDRWSCRRSSKLDEGVWLSIDVSLGFLLPPRYHLYLLLRVLFKLNSVMPLSTGCLGKSVTCFLISQYKDTSHLLWERNPHSWTLHIGVTLCHA